jgi:16S rRNA G966 N2-methylase RsmD
MEFDTRFDVYGDAFVRYDYNDPTEFERAYEFAGSFDVVLADPPFLAQECLEKTVETIRWLKKKNAKVILCTGAVMEDAARALGLEKTAFSPQHRNGLSNEFGCFTNYAPQDPQSLLK